MADETEETVPEAEASVPETDPASEAPVPETEAEADVPATSASDADPVSDETAGEAAAEAASKPRRRRAAPKKAGKQPAVLTPEQRHEARVVERRHKAALRRVGRQKARMKARASAGEPQGTPPREHAGGKQKTRQGVVVSDRAQKTITVRIDVTHRHPRYSKIVRTSNTLHAHDEQGDAHLGDSVLVRECRPLSRTKRWRLVEVLERAE
jgi:small subunit ribosomal protein S17